MARAAAAAGVWDFYTLHGGLRFRILSPGRFAKGLHFGFKAWGLDIGVLGLELSI